MDRIRKIGIVFMIVLISGFAYADNRTVDNLIEFIGRYHTIEQIPFMGGFLNTIATRTFKADGLIVVIMIDNTGLIETGKHLGMSYIFVNRPFVLSVNCFDWYMNVLENSPTRSIFSEEFWQQSLESQRELNYVLMNPATRERVAQTFMRF